MTVTEKNAAQSAASSIHMQVMWNRLVSVVEEQAMTLLRTAFSTSVREAGDLSAGVFDTQGNMLAQAVTGTPGHVNTMAEAVLHFIDEIELVEEGDTYVTNDPWKGTGHLHDITMVTPAFYQSTLIGYFACTAHVVDVGGRGFGADGQSVYEEGILIPIMKFASRGKVNEDLMRILRWNVREHKQVMGDFYSLAACNDVGRDRLVEMMDDYEISNLDVLGDYIFTQSAKATAERFKTLPHGSYDYEMSVDGYDDPVKLAVTLTITEEGVIADFEGTSGESRWGINVPLIYTKAYACYGLKCVIAPDIPNNTASLAPFAVKAPEGCILHAQRPAPVSVRHVLGHMVPDLVLGALSKALPNDIPAEGASALWNIHISAKPVEGNDDGRNAEVLMFNSGGTGARSSLDGLSATAFPSGVHTMPIEATEQTGPIVVWRKELRPGSGGAGKFRGGLGQIIEIGAAEGHEFKFSAMFDRVNHPARGRAGGEKGANGRVELSDGTKLKPKGWQVVPKDQRLVLHAPGGGGFGQVSERDLEAIRADIQNGYLSLQEACEQYDLSVDQLNISQDAAE